MTRYLELPPPQAHAITRYHKNKTVGSISVQVCPLVINKCLRIEKGSHGHQVKQYSVINRVIILMGISNHFPPPNNPPPKTL